MQQKLILILQQQLIIEEKRPFFNKGIDAILFSKVFYSRSINNPTFASKIFNQGRKSRLYVLSALMSRLHILFQHSLNHFLVLEVKALEIIRYQNFVNSKSQIGVLASNRFYDGGAYGNLFGLDGLFNFSDNWSFSLKYF